MIVLFPTIWPAVSTAAAGIDQKTLAKRAGVSLPTVQRMEASDGVVRGEVDTLMKVIQALDEGWN